MENTYGVVVDRIRRGLPLSQHQRETLKRCGLAEEDFRNQKSDAEKAAILNAHTKFDCMDCLPKPKPAPAVPSQPEVSRGEQEIKRDLLESLIRQHLVKAGEMDKRATRRAGKGRTEMSKEKLFNVVARSLDDGSERLIAEGLTKRNADAIVLMAVMRRGCDEECFLTVEVQP
jgi:hypothetical protein